MAYRARRGFRGNKGSHSRQRTRQVTEARCGWRYACCRSLHEGRQANQGDIGLHRLHQTYQSASTLGECISPMAGLWAGMSTTQAASTSDSTPKVHIAGSVERVTYHNSENG